MDDEIIIIDSQEKMNFLINRIQNKELISSKFKFTEDLYYYQLFEFLEIDIEKYFEKYYFYDESKNLHISDSEQGYTWISTYGLISSGKATKDKMLNACINQYTVLDLLLKKAIEICNEETVYNVDSYYFGYLKEITPALFNSVLFYIEVFGKAYLSISNVSIPHTHDLTTLYKVVLENIKKKGHQDTSFYAIIITEFLKNIEYIKTIPGDFKEHFVKYDDNSKDRTVIQFEIKSLKDIYWIMNISQEFINSYYYHSGDDVMYLKPGLYQKLLKMCETEDDKHRIIERYSYLVDDNDT